MSEKNFRLEHDLLGEREIPADAYYGVQTLRAVENYQITGIPISHYPGLIKALAWIKKAAAKANNELGLLPDMLQQAIAAACDELLDGKLHEQFVVDVIQGGAGTSTNMNANEVICNRALELLGHQKGDYQHCHPNIHVNMAQSTNDVYPTSLHLAMIDRGRALAGALDYLGEAFMAKSEEFKDILKMGRTQLQDAVPMSLGQEFHTFALMLKNNRNILREAEETLLDINMGGTAIGTGLNADPEYASRVVHWIAEYSGFPVRLSQDLVEATQSTGPYVQYSGMLKRVAVKLSKICNDLRLLASGPRCGFGEITLPARAPGSSIMPGKVNPVIPEVCNQVAFQVIGADVTVTMAAEAGQLQLNVMEPVILHNLLHSTNMLINACHTLADLCVRDITANRQVCEHYVRNSIGLVTALNPCIGYVKSTEVAKEALERNASVYDLVLEKGYMQKAELDEALEPEKMIKPRHIEGHRE